MAASLQPAPLPDVGSSGAWAALTQVRAHVRSYAASSSALSDLGALQAGASSGYGLFAGTSEGAKCAALRHSLAMCPGPETLLALAAQSSSYSICAAAWGRVAVASCFRAKYGALWAMQRDMQQQQQPPLPPLQALQQPAQPQPPPPLNVHFLTELHFTLQQLQPVFDRLTAPQRQLRRPIAGAGAATAGAGQP